MFANLNGWHAVILLGVILAIFAAIAVVVFIVLAVTRGGRRGASAPAPQAPAPAPIAAHADVAEQLMNLDRLRGQGLVSEAEYEAKRAEILGRL